MDDTGFLKKGVRSAGVQRQYTGTAGRENSQVGTFLAYATDTGHTLIDRELYLPASWTDDRERCRAAAVPDEVAFATKIEKAKAMIERTLTARVPFAWLTADEAYGQSRAYATGLNSEVFHVLATRRTDTVVTASRMDHHVDELVADLPRQAWKRRSCGAGAHGERLYDWARADPSLAREERRHWVIARRSITDPTEIAYYVAYCPEEHHPGHPSASPADGGQSRNVSRPRRTNAVSTTTRSAITTAGTAISLSPWQPTPTSTSAPGS